MIKKENLYAETVITESPFFYDENGRLRVRVLGEESMARTADFQDRNRNGKDDRDEMPEKKPGAIPEIPNQKPPAIRPGTGQPIRGGIGQRIRGGVARPGLGNIIGGIKRPGIGGIARPMPAVPPSGNMTTDQGFAPGEGQGRGVARPAVGVKRPGKPLRSFRFSNQSRIGAGRNTNTRQGLRTVGPANRNMMEDSRPATEYLNIYEESMAQNTASQTTQNTTVLPETQKSANTKAAKKEKVAKFVADWKAKRSEKLAKRSEKFAKREAEVAKFKAAKEERKEERKKFVAQRDDKKRADARERNKQIVFGNRNKKAEMPAAGGRLAKNETALQEKMDLKAAEMGDVIRDFQKSDAPQFKGKSKEKRRMMAVAAKLQADRG